LDVADLGAGTGLFTRLIAPRVAPDGTVYAVDISSTFVDNVLRMAREQGLGNVLASSTPTPCSHPPR
jgi:ubiquinone/menaquinone biosynthesis C-methylase UbiE